MEFLTGMTTVTAPQPISADHFNFLSPETCTQLFETLQAKIQKTRCYQNFSTQLQELLGDKATLLQSSLDGLLQEVLEHSLQLLSPEFEGRIAKTAYSTIAATTDARLTASIRQSNGSTSDPEGWHTEREPAHSSKPAPDCKLLRPAHYEAVPLETGLASHDIAETKSVFSSQSASLGKQQHWEASLRQLGQEIYHWRETYGLSLLQLHSRTHIPLRYLQALELGNIQELPEPIYIKGFIRQIANVLHQDAETLIQSLPEAEDSHAILPTWHQVRASEGFVLRPLHLYVGYGALMASAIGSLSWMMSQGRPLTQVPLLDPNFQGEHAPKTIQPNVEVPKLEIPGPSHPVKGPAWLQSDAHLQSDVNFLLTPAQPERLAPESTSPSQ
jgi:transcriptional regulator with XRE-family HTH domain